MKIKKISIGRALRKSAVGEAGKKFMWDSKKVSIEKRMYFGFSVITALIVLMAAISVTTGSSINSVTKGMTQGRKHSHKSGFRCRAVKFSDIGAERCSKRGARRAGSGAKRYGKQIQA